MTVLMVFYTVNYGMMDRPHSLNGQTSIGLKARIIRSAKPARYGAKAWRFDWLSVAFEMPKLIIDTDLSILIRTQWIYAEAAIGRHTVERVRKWDRGRPQATTAIGSLPLLRDHDGNKGEGRRWWKTLWLHNHRGSSFFLLTFLPYFFRVLRVKEGPTATNKPQWRARANESEASDFERILSKKRLNIEGFHKQKLVFHYWLLGTAGGRDGLPIRWMDSGYANVKQFPNESAHFASTFPTFGRSIASVSWRIAGMMKLEWNLTAVSSFIPPLYRCGHF